MYEPQQSRLRIVKSRVTPEVWARRVRQARQGARKMEAVKRRVDRGLTLNGAVAEVVPESRRSWVMRHWKEYRREGWEALIDRRTGREPRVTKGCQDLVIGARLADGGLSVEAMWQILEKTKGGELPSESVIKRLFARADRKRTPEKSKSAGEVARTASAPRRQEVVEVEELEWAGGELVLAAEMETQGVEGLVDAVCELGEQARQEAQGQEHKPERGLRDNKGQFTGAYNRARSCLILLRRQALHRLGPAVEIQPRS